MQLLAPTTAFAEVEEHLPLIYAKRGLSADAAMAVYAGVSVIVQELPPAFYAHRKSDAQRRIERRDLEDWTVLACALELDCPIWTEDQDFFGTGVPIWTSDRVEIYLAGPTPITG